MARAVLPAVAIRLLPMVVACSALTLAVAAPDAPSRGRLLYDNHCVACHTEQMHWRDKGVVTDWDSLVAQVRVWQARGQLTWSDADIEEVSRFLNEAIYKLPAPRGRG